jgi:hypothetical protein
LRKMKRNPIRPGFSSGGKPQRSCSCSLRIGLG